MTQRLHHIGYIVASVEESLPRFLASAGAVQVSEIFEDPLQKARVVFLAPPDSSGVLLELVAPTEPASPVSAAAARGGGLHHLCYEVGDLDAHLAAMRSRKAVLIRPAKPAVAFGGRRIAWMITPEKLVLEFLEAAPPHNSASSV